MKSTTVTVLLLLLFLSVSPACIAKSSISYPKFFNSAEFVGFVSINGDSNTVMLDYDLDGADGNPVLFKNCNDVKRTPETAVATHQYHLWRLMQLNCKAAAMINNASASTQSHWPSTFDYAFIAELPATAIPDLGGNSLDGRKGLLKDAEPSLEITSIDSHSAEVIGGGDLAITYVVMARGDFDQDGMEDILLRLDWNIVTAFGKGFSLLLLAKPDFSAEAEIVWRDR